MNKKKQGRTGAKISGAHYSKEMPLAQWARMFREIYFPLQNYGRSRFEIFTRLTKAFGAGSHFLFRSHDPKGAREYLAKLFAWYCALANRLELDLEDALWAKYPFVCPRCLSPACTCQEPPGAIDSKKLTALALENAHRRPTNLREWQVMFASIYRGPSGKATVPASRDRLAVVFARMAEEIGEVAEALGQDRVVDADARFIIKNEMADFGAWIFGLANNLQYVDSSAAGVTLADVTWALYPGKCHRCKGSRCVCVRGSYGLELAEKGAMGPSQFDERTGLADYKALKGYLEQAASDYGPGNYTWSMIFIDLDNFKSINTKFGHHCGDEVLRIAAKQMEMAAGDRGIVFRRGGEEFVAVLRSNQEAAIIVAEEIRRRLERKRIVVPNQTRKIIRVTASLGVASCLTDVSSPEELEATAESRMKEAKGAGKNCVIPKPSAKLLIRSAGLR